MAFDFKSYQDTDSDALNGKSLLYDELSNLLYASETDNFSVIKDKLKILTEQSDYKDLHVFNNFNHLSYLISTLFAYSEYHMKAYDNIIVHFNHEFNNNQYSSDNNTTLLRPVPVPKDEIYYHTYNLNELVYLPATERYEYTINRYPYDNVIIINLHNLYTILNILTRLKFTTDDNVIICKTSNTRLGFIKPAYKPYNQKDHLLILDSLITGAEAHMTMINENAADFLLDVVVRHDLENDDIINEFYYFKQKHAIKYNKENNVFNIFVLSSVCHWILQQLCYSTYNPHITEITQNYIHTHINHDR